MEPDGDPEARIRELERSLNDRAGTAELGVANQSPYPPPVYGEQPPMRPPGRKFIWLLAAFGALITTGVAGLIVYSTKPSLPQDTPMSSARPARPTVVKTPVRTTATPSTSATPGPTYAPPGSTVTVSGTEKHVTIDCDDCLVSVSGVSNTVEIVGHCDTLSVSGIENTISAETARKISVSGFDNKITYLDGEPEISKSGGGNTVEHG